MFLYCGCRNKATKTHWHTNIHINLKLNRVFYDHWARVHVMELECVMCCQETSEFLMNKKQTKLMEVGRRKKKLFKILVQSRKLICGLGSESSTYEIMPFSRPLTWLLSSVLSAVLKMTNTCYSNTNTATHWRATKLAGAKKKILHLNTLSIRTRANKKEKKTNYEILCGDSLARTHANFAWKPVTNLSIVQVT